MHYTNICSICNGKQRRIVAVDQRQHFAQLVAFPLSGTSLLSNREKEPSDFVAYRAETGSRKKGMRMMRCKHNNALVMELVDGVGNIYEIKKDGEVGFSGGVDVNPTGFVEVTCLDCYKTFNFNLFVSEKGYNNLPKWAKRLIEKTGLSFMIIEQGQAR